MTTSALARRLRALVGDDGVVDADDVLLVYECDGYTLERAAPELVVLPRTPAETAAVVRLLAEERVPFVPRGAGTGLSGGALAEGVVLLGLNRLNRVLHVDPVNRIAVVESGVVNATL
ncbi:MAG: FAD-binding oxidoreductase, partial [Alphaproteobacteria bacterium]